MSAFRSIATVSGMTSRPFSSRPGSDYGHRSPFQRAEAYAELWRPAAPSVAEAPAAPGRYGFSERHLQCVWADEALRPAELTDREGEPIRVLHPGEWNLEAGPDFLGAVLETGRERRRIQGDIEIHIAPADWTAHGHDRDPAYRDVRGHVTWAEGTADHLPPGCLSIPLGPALSRDPEFSFDQIDLTAYPYAGHTGPSPCAGILARWPVESVADFLASAGECRLARKAAGFASRLAARPAGAVLWDCLLDGLGYKHNRAPFRRIAQAAPPDRLAQAAEGDPVTAHAILLGLADLLPSEPDPAWDQETLAWWRKAWDAWWVHRPLWAVHALDRSEWTFAFVRPDNRPERRLAAVAAWACSEPPLPDRIAGLTSLGPEELRGVLDALIPKPPPYWDRRSALGSPVMASRRALLGVSRAAALLVNTVIPLAAAAGVPVDSEALDRLPPEPLNHLMKAAAHRLLGPSHSPRAYRSELARQGLLQIFTDLVLDDPEGRRQRELAERLEAMHPGP